MGPFYLHVRVVKINNNNNFYFKIIKKNYLLDVINIYRWGIFLIFSIAKLLIAIFLKYFFEFFCNRNACYDISSLYNIDWQGRKKKSLYNIITIKFLYSICNAKHISFKMLVFNLWISLCFKKSQYHWNLIKNKNIQIVRSYNCNAYKFWKHCTFNQQKQKAALSLIKFYVFCKSFTYWN